MFWFRQVVCRMVDLFGDCLQGIKQRFYVISICGRLFIKAQTKSKIFFKCYCSVINSNNDAVKFIAKRVDGYSTGPICRNISMLRVEYNVESTENNCNSTKWNSRGQNLFNLTSIHQMVSTRWQPFIDNALNTNCISRHSLQERLFIDRGSQHELD